jgi:hypothetical protein
MGVAAHEAVVAVEAASERPAIVGPRGGDLVGGREVPLADRVRVVPLLVENLGEEAVLERDVPVVAGEAGRDLRDAGMWFEWWLRPVRMQDRVGEQSAVVCMFE